MKRLTTIANAENYAEQSVASFKHQTLDKIKAMIADNLPAELLDSLNLKLTGLNRRPITMEDIAKIAYVHLRSIKEKDGYSPYARIKTFCSKNGNEYDNMQIGVATELLTEMEVLKIIQKDTKKGQCRRYEIPFDVKQRIFNMNIPTP